MISVARKTGIALVLLAIAGEISSASKVLGAEREWRFQSAHDTEANELGNCAIYSDEASILFFAGTHPKDERFIAFVPALEKVGNKGPINWKFKSTSYYSSPGDWEFFGPHYVIDDSFFLTDLVRSKHVTVEYGTGDTIMLDLSGISPVMKKFMKCVDDARRSMASYEAYRKASDRPFCSWNEGVYTTADSRDPKALYTFEFKNQAVQSGEVVFMKHVDGQLSWSNVSKFACSNGASICTVSLELANGASQDVIFDTLETDGGETYMVFSAARQQVYITRSGLKKFFSSAQDREDAIPFNSYKLTACKKPQ